MKQLSLLHPRQKSNFSTQVPPTAPPSAALRAFLSQKVYYTTKVRRKTASCLDEELTILVEVCTKIFNFKNKIFKPVSLDP
jgi:hypothetical protein